MSWIRSAMNKAAEVPGGAMFRAAVRTYTDTVVQHAGNSVSEAAKMFHDRFASRNIQSFSDAVKKLEEGSVSCKGEERVQLLRRWLVSLQEIEKLDENHVENDGKNSEDPGKSVIILYYDPDLGDVPMNFRDVFLHSQALEGMTMSMILGEPNEEEVLLLHEIFGLCLTGGKEVHDVVVKYIQDLAKSFSVYDGEMLVRKEELLQFAQTAISGLKITADVLRIDSEISQIQQSLNRIKCQKSAGENSSEPTSDESSTDTKEFVAHIEFCCQLKSLLLKKTLLKKGETQETHTQKVYNLKVILESLHNSENKTEKRILEHREQKKEILNFHVVRTSEVSQIEKDLEAEVSAIEKQRDELEAELKKVNNTLADANARLQEAREERLQFDEDNNDFLLSLKEKEDELSKTINSYKAEADTCSTFIDFLEATWDFQNSFINQRDKQVNDQLQNHEEYFINATTNFLTTFKHELVPAIANVRKLLEDLKGYQYLIDPDEEFLQDIKQRENFEKEYLDAEAKVVNIFDAVESIKELFNSQIHDPSRNGVEVVNELFNIIERFKREFKTIKRPILRIEIPTNEEEFSPKSGSPQGAIVPSPVRVIPDFKSIFTQKLVKSPSKKPYIPLGGSPENSPLSTESKQHNFDEDKSNVTLKNEKENLEKTSSAQESKMHEISTLEKETETTEGGNGKTSEITSTEEKGSGNSDATASQPVDPNVELSKSTSGIEDKNEVSTEEVAK